MQKKFAGNLLFLVIANLLVKPCWIFGIDRHVQNLTGPALYGTYFALFNYSFLFSVVLDFGINNFNNRAVARHPARVTTYFNNLMVMKMVLAVFYFLVTLFSAVLGGFSALHLKLLMVLAFNQVVLTYILYLRSNLTALHYFKADAVVSVMDKLLAIIFCALLIWRKADFTASALLHFFVLAQSIALLLTAVLAYILLRTRQGFVVNWWRLRFARAILMKASPYALLGLLMSIYYRVDAVMLERLHSATETGIYAQSFRLLDAINQFGYLAGIPLLPLFASQLQKRENISPLLGFSALGMFICSFVGVVLCYFFAMPIMELFYTDTTPYSAEIFRWLMWSFVPISSVYIFGTLLTAQGSIGLLNAIALLGVLLNVSLNLFLIPVYGAIGATFATLVTQAVVACVHMYACIKIFKLKLPVTTLMRLVVYMLLVWASTYALQQLAIGWMLQLLISGLVAVLLLLASGLAPKATWRNLFYQK